MMDADRKATKLFIVAFDLLAGCFKIAVILAPLWLPLIMIFGPAVGGSCRGDCAVGYGMLFIGIMAISIHFGPVLVVVGVPLVILLLHFWTRRRPMQFVSGIAIIPLLVLGVWAFAQIRDTIEASQIRASQYPGNASDPVLAIR
jgi:hypothetical protein